MERSCITHRARCLTYILAILVFECTLLGQANYGTIAGTVTDPSKQPIFKASVEVVAEDQGQQYHAASNESGNFVVTQLRPGTYRIRIQATGFQTFVRNGIPVASDKTTRVDGSLP